MGLDACDDVDEPQNAMLGARRQPQEATHSTHVYHVSRQGILPRQYADQQLQGWGREGGGEG